MPGETWTADAAGAHHEVTISIGMRNSIAWSIDGEQVAEKVTMDDGPVLSYGGQAIKVRTRHAKVRRVTLVEAEGPMAGAAALVRSGVELEPVPGSEAARRLEWIRDHPRLHALRSGALTALGLGLIALLTWLGSLIPWPSVDLPDIPVPTIPWPDIPWPDLPRVPLPDWRVPGWLEQVLGLVQYVWPVLVAIGLAAAESRRRRRQDARRHQHKDSP
ncbi:hypothetical protein K8W59_13980 [Nocardioides rotundus]|uniref:hypothetical protein n=1 Tax=Nocardioides rotundus TaxID=1774216 RepID=UPI001CBBCE73|nr:hypothetical protein [Nocardioides rotundus]UAL28914.1 hypothetical protein K8W59_13980 [Nocardioides rotundus]